VILALLALALVVLAAVCVAGFVLVRRDRERTAAELARARAEPTGADAASPKIDGRLFADVVLRESVVKAAALGHGVRRALAPEVRNRIRFEMKREVKRSRRARKDEYRRVRDEIRARERAAQRVQQRVAG
jgi:hypothetical protein